MITSLFKINNSNDIYALFLFLLVIDLLKFEYRFQSVDAFDQSHSSLHQRFQGETLHNISSISQMQINSSALTITGLHFHPTRVVSEWVERVFGNMSVHFSSNTVYEKVRYVKPLLLNESQNSSRLIAEKIDVAYISNNKPRCSIDLLGSVPLDVRNNNLRTRPFTNEYKLIGPAIGNASLNILELGESWKCYYRGLYENWKVENDKSHPNFISVFFYCPQFQSASCMKLRKHGASSNSILEMHVRMELIHQIWENKFNAMLYQPTRVLFRNSEKLQLGMCIANPYTSTDEAKADSNGKMFQDWIRYYSNLGIIIFIYDRDAMSYRYVSSAIDEDETVRRHTIYYNYTMRGLLDPASRGMQYDNNELLGDLKPKNKSATILRFHQQGVDKTQTLTQCRFEAKAVYGIDHVIVADYDEFLYCPSASTNFESQAKYLSQTIRKMKGKHVDQLTFQQIMLVNKTESPRNCLIDKVHQKKSIFDCFHSFNQIMATHSLKSIHLGHKCPLTGYHSACPPHSMQPRLFDCRCINENEFPSVCSFIHFSTNQRLYVDKHREFLEKSRKVENTTRNEISEMLYPITQVTGVND